MSVRKAYIAIFFFVIILCGKLSAQTAFDNLIWSDEFEYTGAPDPDKWGYDIGGGGWGNDELQYYTNRPENIRVEDGKLTITALLEDYNSNEYTSARITSRGKGDWLYCRVEVSAKLPAGKGTWPAIWMLPTDREYGGWPSSGEIDIMEHVGYDMGTVYGTIHTEAYNSTLNNARGDDIYISDVNTSYHVYVIEWSPDTIHFYADNIRYYSYPNYGTGYERWPFDKRFHLLMNLAIGGEWGGQEGVDNSIFPQTLEIDYVRIYQRFQQQEIIGPGQVNAREEEVSFSVLNYPGAVYDWTFPEGVTVTEGQSEHEITVNWGDTGGEVIVEQSYNNVTFTSSLDVQVIDVPQGDTLTIKGTDTDLGTWSIKAGEGNTLLMEDEE